MKRKIVNRHHKLGFLSAILLLGICLVMSGTAYARYQKHMTEDLDFVVKEPDTFRVISESGGWTKQDAYTEYAFSVNNLENQEDSYFSLRLITTLGFRYNQAKISLIVTDDKGVRKVYEGIETAIDSSSPIYQEMGEGTEYHFYSEAGDVLSWKLEGGKSSSQRFAIRITGQTMEPNLMQIVVSQSKQIE